MMSQHKLEGLSIFTMHYIREAVRMIKDLNTSLQKADLILNKTLNLSISSLSRSDLMNPNRSTTELCS